MNRLISLKHGSHLIPKLTVIFAVILLAGATPSALAQTQISLRVDTVSVSPNSATVTIPVWLDNPANTLAGFEIFFQLNRPDMIKFESKIDSIFDTLHWNCLAGEWPACLDSELVIDTMDGYDFSSVTIYEIAVGSCDSSGALISGWELVDSRPLGAQGWDTKISAFADILSPPITEGIAPQTGGMLLKLHATVLPIPDTLTDRTVEIHISQLPDYTNFSDPFGVSLTNQLTNGSVTFLPSSCCETPGDIDHNGVVTIADVTYGIGRIFSGFAPPYCNDEADANGDGAYNISDTLFLIARIFTGGPAPVCGQTGS